MKRIGHISISVLLVLLITNSCQKTDVDLSLLTSDQTLSTCPLSELCPTDSNCDVFNVIQQYPRFFSEDCENLLNADNRMKANCAHSKMIEFINEHIVYPQIAIDNNIEGDVTIEFVVRKSMGCLSDIKIVKDIGYGCGIELQRVVSTMPDFVVGRHADRPVNAIRFLQYSFEL